MLYDWLSEDVSCQGLELQELGSKLVADGDFVGTSRTLLERVTVSVWDRLVQAHAWIKATLAHNTQSQP